METDQYGDETTAEVVAESSVGHYLIVRHAFGSYRKGDAIRDEGDIKKVLSSPENAHNVHKVLE
jgi:hypothetical protein